MTICLRVSVIDFFSAVQCVNPLACVGSVPYLLDNQLRDAISNLDFEIGIRQVRQYHTHWTAIVRIDDTRKRINAMLMRKPRPRRYSTIYSHQSQSRHLNNPAS